MRRRVPYIFLVVLSLLGIARAEELPVLRLEAGMHLAAIRQVGLDAAGRYLVTASHDKTARVWEIATGRQLMVLRPPLGEGNEGRLDAVAISPDGAWVATGGWTGYQWDHSDSIYLFDRASGQMVKRLRGLPNVITRLTFSPDGQRLAAVMSQGGLRVFQVKEGKLLGQDSIDESCYGVDFDRRGRLVTGCFDGQVRLYDGNTKRLAQVAVSSGKQPCTVRFSSNGERIAVGYADTVAVDVLAGKDLKLLYHPDTTGVDNGDLGIVAWSANGHQLCAAGGWDVARRFPIRCWSQAGKGPYRDTPATHNTLLDLTALPGGGMAFGAGDPAWGTVEADGKLGALHSGPLADFPGKGQQFLLDRKGQVVQFGYELGDQQPASFALGTRALSLGAKAAGLGPPRVQVPGLEISGWEDTTAVTINGSPLLLDKYETAHSLAIVSDGKSFLLGSGWYLRHFTSQGKLLWQKPSPGDAWAVNLSEDGRLAVAAFADGTIRWYNVKDGTELLAFFPHADKKRWVLWTPEGYYDASVGGEDLIGWHINRGVDKAADFFPASLLRKQFYRPDLVSRALSVDKPERAGAFRLASLPPISRIVSPTGGATVSTTTVKLLVHLRSTSGKPITQIATLLDGRPASTPPQKVNNQGQEQDVEIAVPIPERDCTVGVMARTATSDLGEPAEIKLHWSRPAAPPSSLPRPNLYLVSIGITKYPKQKDPQKRMPELQFPAKDAQDVAEIFARQSGRLYQEVKKRVLVDKDATRAEILKALEWLERESKQDDIAIMFLAGHGITDFSERYYFMPYEGDVQDMRSSMIPGEELKETLRRVAARKVVLMLDTCHSGALLGKATRGARLDGFINQLVSAQNGVVVLTASTGIQAAQEDPAWKNGAFTKALLEGLSGKADYYKSGGVTWSALARFVSERVKELTHGEQASTMSTPQGASVDYPLTVL